MFFETIMRGHPIGVSFLFIWCMRQRKVIVDVDIFSQV